MPDPPFRVPFHSQAKLTRAKSQFEKLKAQSAEHKERAASLKAEIASLKELQQQQHQQQPAAPDAEDAEDTVAADLRQELVEARVAYSQVSSQMEALLTENEALRARLAEAEEAEALRSDLERLVAELREEAHAALERAADAERRLALSERRVEDGDAALAEARAAREDLLWRLGDTEEARGRLQLALQQARDDATAAAEAAAQTRRSEAEALATSESIASSSSAERVAAAEGRAAEAEGKVAALKEKLGLAKQKFLKMQVKGARPYRWAYKGAHAASTRDDGTVRHQILNDSTSLCALRPPSAPSDPVLPLSRRLRSAKTSSPSCRAAWRSGRPSPRGSRAPWTSGSSVQSRSRCG